MYGTTQVNTYFRLVGSAPHAAIRPSAPLRVSRSDLDLPFADAITFLRTPPVARVPAPNASIFTAATVFA